MPRTFLGLGVFTETGLVLCGSYLLLKALWWPLETGEIAVIVAGLLLALGTSLLLYLVRPGGSSVALAQTDNEIQDEPPPLQAPATTCSVTVEPREKAAHAAAGH